jgi:hypothetical protein
VAPDRQAPSLADALAQLDAFRSHPLYESAFAAVVDASERHGGWEAAARATEIADAFEEEVLRRKLSRDIG